ncbi:MAG: T9SS type A sorting domain-containing protein [Bacteroidales bacterium]|nr:T9SS type A sorting domain-containing protein [Bacteroidales bacterium]
MKRITFLALSLCLTMGVFAQSFNMGNTLLKNQNTEAKELSMKSLTDLSGINLVPAVFNTNAKASVTITDVEETYSQQYGYIYYAYVNFSSDVESHAYLCYDVTTWNNILSNNQDKTEDQVKAEAFYYNDTAYQNRGEQLYSTINPDTINYYNLDYNTDYIILVDMVTGSEHTYASKTFRSHEQGGTGLAAITELSISGIGNNTASITLAYNDQTAYYFALWGEVEQLSGEGVSTLGQAEDYLEEWEEGYNNGNYTNHPSKQTNQYNGASMGTNLTASTDYVFFAVPYNVNDEKGTSKEVRFTTTGTGVGLADGVENINVTVYPNPATDYVSVSSLNLINEVTLFNSLGQSVYTNTVKANGYNIPVSNLQKGVYFIQVKTQNGVASKRVVVE